MEKARYRKPQGLKALVWMPCKENVQCLREFLGKHKWRQCFQKAELGVGGRGRTGMLSNLTTMDNWLLRSCLGTWKGIIIKNKSFSPYKGSRSPGRGFSMCPQLYSAILAGMKRWIRMATGTDNILINKCSQLYPLKDISTSWAVQRRAQKRGDGREEQQQHLGNGLLHSLPQIGMPTTS